MATSKKPKPKKKAVLDATLVNLSTTTGPVHLSVTALLGPNGAVISQGYGGWTLENRPRATALTFWGGAQPFQMTLQLVLDDFVRMLDTNFRGTVDDDCFRIERMALPPDGNSVPPIIDIDGQSVPRTTTRWFIQDIAWEDVERRADGRRMRQVFTVTLVEFVQDRKLKASERARKTGKQTMVRGGPSTPV